jgi:8-oxo-dGTP pyrophosphatase MutT (NUDIX family)
MHRNNLKKLICAYFPTDPEERLCKNRFLDLIEKRADCFERSCFEPGHITASAWLLSNTGDRVLLMHHRKLDGWFQLGGHCDGDADVLRVAIKEAQEESGILGIKPVLNTIFDLDIHVIPENKKEPAHYHYDVRFLLQVQEDVSFVQNEESLELAWFGLSKSKLPTQAPSIMRMFDKWEAYLLEGVHG